MENIEKIIKHILLDVHGVITEGNERKHFLSQMEKKYDMDFKLHNELWVKHIDSLDKNIEKTSDYIEIVNTTFHTSFSVNEYYGMFLKHIKVNRVLIKKLDKTGIKIYIVSDNILPISTGLNKVFGMPFKKYKKFYSYKLGLTKKEGMLKKVTKLAYIKPNECLFIDDSKRNIDAAKEIGINTLLFKTNRKLFLDLKKFSFYNG